MGEVNIDEFFCPNEACSDYGKKGKENIVLKEHYGKQNTALLRCKACKKTFSHGISASGSTSFAGSNRRAYKNALVGVYGVEEQPEYKGRGRPPNPKKVPPPYLKYGQVVKYREGEEVTGVKKRVVFGNEEEVLSVLKLAGNSINTSYIERNNLTVRNGVSRVIRKTIDFSKRLNPLVMHLCLFFTWFNLVKPHDALKIEIADGRRRWKQRTPVASC